MPFGCNFLFASGLQMMRINLGRGISRIMGMGHKLFKWLWGTLRYMHSRDVISLSLISWSCNFIAGAFMDWFTYVTRLVWKLWKRLFRTVAFVGWSQTSFKILSYCAKLHIWMSFVVVAAQVLSPAAFYWITCIRWLHLNLLYSSLVGVSLKFLLLVLLNLHIDDCDPVFFMCCLKISYICISIL